jgi:uncharacterized protein (TIGR03067 family)
MKTWAAILVTVQFLLPPASAADQGPPRGLDGTWKCVTFITAGYDFGPRESAQFEFVFTKGKGSHARNKTTLWKAEYTFQPAEQPNAVDIVIIEGENGKALKRFALGIYEIKDGQLRICMTEFGSKRPSEEARPGKFASTPQNGFDLFICKRVAE